MNKHLLSSAVSLLFVITAVCVSAKDDRSLPRRGSLGLPILPATAEMRQKAGVAENIGVAIGKPVPGFTADRAGLKEGDFIFEINGKPLLSTEVFEVARNLSSGSNVSFKVFRDGKSTTLTATHMEKPKDPGTDSYSVSYEHVSSLGKRMRVIISRPKTPGKHPALFFIQGASGNSYDFNLNGTGIDAPILYRFANNGYVTLRVEKPGVGDSEGGPFTTVDFNTEMDIYRQAMVHLKHLDYVDPNNIFIFGHSMGGAFGPMLAAESPVKGLVMYGVVSRTWHEYLLGILRYQFLLEGKSYGEVDDTVRNGEIMINQIFVENKSPEEAMKSHPDQAQFIAQGFPGGLFNGRANDFWRQLLKTNFASYWEKINVPVLAVHGASDFVSYEIDHQLIADIVNKNHPGNGKFVSLPKSDHLMYDWSTEAESQKHSGTGTYSNSFENLAFDWIEKLRK